MNTMEGRLAKLGKGQVEKLNKLENELGLWVIALDSYVSLTEMTPDQLKELQVLEKELDVVLLAAGPLRSKEEQKRNKDRGEEPDKLRVEFAELTENQLMKVQSLEKELEVNIIVVKPPHFKEIPAELNEAQKEKLQALENKLDRSIVALQTFASQVKPTK